MTSTISQPAPSAISDSPKAQDYSLAWANFFARAPLLDRREVAAQMSALREAGATPPINFFHHLAQEGDTQSLLGALEGMPSLLESPYLPLAFEAYADEADFSMDGQSPMERAFGEAILMGMKLAGQDPLLFSEPILRSRVEAANLEQAAGFASSKPKGRL